MDNTALEFITSIKLGNGRARVLFDQYHSEHLEKILSRYVTKTYPHDPQCEECRSTHMSFLIDASRNSERLICKVSKALLSETDYWNRYYLYNLAGIYALRGHPIAKQAIYTAFTETVSQELFESGYDIILRLFKLEGLIICIKKICTFFNQQSEVIAIPDIVSEFLYYHPDEDIIPQLRELAKDDKDVEFFINIKYDNLPATAPVREPFSFDSLQQKINQQKLVVVPPKMAKEMSTNDITKVANLLSSSTDPRTISACLKVFYHVKYPLEPSLLIKLASSPNSRSNSVVKDACNALSFFKTDTIRELAIRKLSSFRFPEIYLPLLISNSHGSDYKLLSGLVDHFKNQIIIHEISLIILRIIENNPDKRFGDTLYRMYRKLSCSNHRYDIVELMDKMSVLPPDVKAELPYDSEEDTRLFFSENS